MGNLAGFNAMEVEPNVGMDIIPAGEYEACIVASEMKQTKSGNGSYLNLEIQILSGQYQNRRLFEKLNLNNPSATAVRIAESTLSSICRAIFASTEDEKDLEPGDSKQLHNKAFRISVGVRKREDTGEMQNEVKSFKPRVSQPVTTQLGMANSRQLATADVVAGYSTAKKGPWEK